MSSLEKTIEHYANEIDDINVFIYPKIPEKKFNNAIKSYADLDEEEIPLVLVDDTVFGSAKEGLLITQSAIYTKEAFEESKYLLLQDIEDIYFKKSLLGCNLIINDKKIEFTQPDKNSIELVGTMLLDLVNISKNLISDTEDEQEDDEEENYLQNDENGNNFSLIDILNNYYEQCRDNQIEFYPTISIENLENAIESFADISEYEVPLALIDNTLLGSAEEGMLVTNIALYMKQSFEEPEYILLKDIEEVYVKKSFFEEKLIINGNTIFTLLEGNSLLLFTNMMMELINIPAENFTNVINEYTERKDLIAKRESEGYSQLEQEGTYSTVDENEFYNDIRIVKYLRKENRSPSFLIDLDGVLYISNFNRFVALPDDVKELYAEIDDANEINEIVALLASNDIEDESVIGDISHLFNCSISEDQDEDDNPIVNPILQTIIGVKLNTANVTKMISAFQGCTSLKYVDIDTSNVENMAAMFQDCLSLEMIPTLNTNSATNMYGMFLNCISLKEVKNFDISNGVYAMSMFSGCVSLKKVNILNSDIINANTMFADCTSLEDVNNLDLSNSSDFHQIFHNCSNLHNIKIKIYPNEKLMENYLSIDYDNEYKNLMDMCLEKAKTEDEFALLMVLPLMKYNNMFYGCSSLDTKSIKFLKDGWTTMNGVSNNWKDKYA